MINLFIALLFFCLIGPGQAQNYIRQTEMPTVPGCPYDSCIMDSGMYLNVTGAPEVTGRLGYDPVIYQPGIRGTGTLTGRIIFPHVNDGIYGCTPFANSATDDGTPLKDNFVVVSGDGPCFLPYMILALWRSPNTIFIFWDSSGNNIIPRGFPSPATGGIYNAYPFTIPWLVISKFDGQKLYNAWKKDPITGLYPVINATIARGGSASENTRKFVKDLLQSVTFTYDFANFPSAFSSPYMIRPDQFNPDTMDPCQMRFGPWCENGEIVHLMLQNGGMRGSIPPSFGNLTELIFVYFGNNYLSGPFPDTMCGNMQHLRLIGLSYNQFTSVPDCWDTFPVLQAVELSNNKLATFPSSICNNLFVSNIDFSFNYMTGSPCAKFNSPYLQYLNLGSNYLSGPVPTFANSDAPQFGLYYFDMSANNLTTLNVNSFNNLPSLETVNLQRNNITGTLPLFINSTKLQYLRLDSNNFGGSIPPVWTKLKNLIALRLQRNQITYATASVLRTIPTLDYIDLSYNQLKNPPGSDPCISFVVLMNLNKTSYIDVSYNQFSGYCIPVFIIVPYIQTVLVAGNQIRSVPKDLFTARNLLRVDFSNNLLTGSLPEGIPMDNLKTANFNNNPNFKGTLPPYLNIDYSSYVVKTGDTFGCPKTTLANGNVFGLDASYYNYIGCTCLAGYYDAPPNCRLIPHSVSLTPNTVFDPLVTGGPRSNSSISDGWYGNQRQIPGTATSWYIDARDTKVVNQPNDNFLSFDYFAKSSSVNMANYPAGSIVDSVRVISVILMIDLDKFNEVTDTITIYDRELDDSPTIIFSVNGVNAPSLIPADPASWPSIVSNNNFNSTHGPNYNSFGSLAIKSIMVLSKQATIQYSSRKTSGVLFYSVYALSSIAPSSYFLDKATDLYQKIPEEYHISRGIQIAIFTLSGIVAGLTLCTLFYLYYHKESALVKASSKNFTFFTLLMLACLALGSSLYAVVPSEGDGVCNARLWVSCISLMSVLSVLAAKAFRVSVIFGSKKLIEIRSVTDMHVMATVAGCLSTQFIMLAIFSGLNMSYSDLASYSNDQVVWACNTQNGFNAWMATQIVIFFALMICAAWVAYKTRMVPSAFNESVHILLSLQLLLVFCLLLVPLDWALVSNSPNASVVIQGGGQIILSLFLLLFNYVPKVYYLSRGMGNNANMIKSNTLGSRSSMNTSSHAQSQSHASSGVETASELASTSSRA